MSIAHSLKTCNINGTVLCAKPHILDWTFIVESLRHTCAIIISDQHFDQDYLGKGEVLPNRDLDRFVSNI